MIYSHILRIQTTDDGQGGLNKAAWLFRAFNGMMVGRTEFITVIIGENPQRCEGRVFIDSEHAMTYLWNTVAKDDAEKLGIDCCVEIRDDEGSIILVSSDSILANDATPRARNFAKKLN